MISILFCSVCVAGSCDWLQCDCDLKMVPDCWNKNYFSVCIFPDLLEKKSTYKSERNQELKPRTNSHVHPQKMVRHGWRTQAASSLGCQCHCVAT